MTAEYEGDFAADQDFAVQDSRKGREGQDRSDKAVPSRFYLAISDVRALVRLASSYILVPSFCFLVIYQPVTRSALTTCCQKWTGGKTLSCHPASR